MGNRGRKGQPAGGRRIGWNPEAYREERRAAHTRTEEALTCPGANRRAAAETLGFAVDSSRGLASGDESISDLNRKNPGEPDHPCRCRVNVQADAISSQATQAIHELVGTHARMFSARLRAHRQQLFPPTGRKTLPKFKSGEATRLIGTDDGVLRRHRSPARDRPSTSPAAADAHIPPRTSRKSAPTSTRTARATSATCPRRSGGERLQVIAVVNFKGGSGKTTTTTHLAQHLALRSYRIQPTPGAALAGDLAPDVSEGGPTRRPTAQGVGGGCTLDRGGGDRNAPPRWAAAQPPHRAQPVGGRPRPARRHDASQGRDARWPCARAAAILPVERAMRLLRNGERQPRARPAAVGVPILRGGSGPGRRCGREPAPARAGGGGGGPRAGRPLGVGAVDHGRARVRGRIGQCDRYGRHGGRPSDRS